MQENAESYHWLIITNNMVLRGQLYDVFGDIMAPPCWQLSKSKDEEVKKLAERDVGRDAGREAG